MSNPREGDEHVVKRIIRYLNGKPRVAIRYEFQEDPITLTVFNDSDWAGDRITRRSTSGGCLMRGGHLIKCWAKGQHVIALSSGEAELYSSVKIGSEAIGLKSMMMDLGYNVGITIHIDATAAIGMLMKEGLSGVRHTVLMSRQLRMAAS